jgi:uncharacterized protein YgiM (DUF1202 family)
VLLEGAKLSVVGTSGNYYKIKFGKKKGMFLKSMLLKSKQA